MLNSLDTDTMFEEVLTRAARTMIEGTFEDFYNIYESTYSEDLVQLIWNTLQAHGKDNLVITGAFSPIVMGRMTSSISITLEHSTPYNVLGNGGDLRLLPAPQPYTGAEYSCPVRDTIGVYILASNRILVRALDVFVKSAIYAAAKVFSPNGAAPPFWVSSADLAPIDVGGGAETIMKFSRKMTWGCDTNMAIREFGRQTYTAKPFLIHSEGTFVDAYPDAEARLYVQLLGKTPGGVKPR